MGTRTKNGLILFALAAVAVLGVVFLKPPGRVTSVIESVPEDSYLVATLDAEAIRASPIARLVPDETVTRLLGMRAFAEACGWDPASRLEELALTIPEAGDTGEFGIALKARVSKIELATCGDKLVSLRGSHAKSTKRGSFFVLEDDGEGRAKKPPQLAVRDDGVVLLAQGPWLSRMLDTTEGKVPNVTKHPAHAALRTSLAHVGKPLFLATAVLPKALRDRLRGELVKEVLAGVASSMDGVLSVEAAGLALGNSGSGDAAEAPSELAGEFLCESEVGAKAVFALADSKRNEWKRDLTLRLVGVGRVVDALELRQEGRAVRFGLKMPLAEMVALVERVMELRGKSFGAQKSGTPDEVIPSRPQPPKPNP